MIVRLPCKALYRTQREPYSSHQFTTLMHIKKNLSKKITSLLQNLAIKKK